MNSLATEHLISERSRLGMSMSEVAEMVGVSDVTISAWEHGERTPLSPHLMRLSYIYGCSPEYLLGLTDDRNGQPLLR